MSEENNITDVREDLENCAKQLEEQTKEVITNNDNEDEHKIENFEAPLSYNQEMTNNFKELPKKWQKYLTIREEEINKGFEKLEKQAFGNQKVEEIYNARKDELQKSGINSSAEWIEKLMKVDEALNKNPQEIIKILQDSYGLNANEKITEKNNLNIKYLSDGLAGEVVKAQVKNFSEQRDETGQKVHPFFDEVAKDMFELLQKGVVKNLDDAYETAVWGNKNTRDKLILKQVEENLKAKSQSALKQKELTLASKSKAIPAQKDLSLREELEMRFAALGEE